jgi:hypothetical protein
MRESVGPLPEVTKPFDPAPAREQARGRLAGFLIGLVGLTVLLGFLGLALDWGTFAEMKELTTTILAAVAALAGTAVGFYFGGKDH